MESLRLLTLSFNLPLTSRQLPHWRGAFVEMAGWQDDLFHNHNNKGVGVNGQDSEAATALSEDGPLTESHRQQPPLSAAAENRSLSYHHRYPLIQYRVRNGKAAIFAINEGVEALQQVLAQSDWRLNWQGNIETLQVEDLGMNEHYFRLLAEPTTYRLQQWLALNQENYREWQGCKNYFERGALLQKK